MRTTLTLDPDIARRLKERAHATRSSFKDIVNETLRRGLSAQQGGAVAPFVVTPHRMGGFLPGVDPTKLMAEAEELDDLEKFGRETA
jgi:hypothetical protein